jgi:hypothetical protein
VRPSTVPSRRLSSRIGVAEDVWVLWNCKGEEDLSRIKDLSIGGLFLQTPTPKPAGVSVRLHFLVQEGEIKAEAVVRHARRDAGVGLKFLALSEQGKPRLAALLTRLRTTSHARGES